MKIEIESRESIIARAKEPFPEGTALISITDPDNDFAVLENKPEYLLQMKFDDVSNGDLDEILCGFPAIAEAMQTAKKLQWFTDEQAQEVVAFYKSIVGRAKRLICQCEYGKSRSAGIAAAIGQYMYGRGIEVFTDERYYPNKLVCKKVLTALRELGYDPDEDFVDEERNRENFKLKHNVFFDEKNPYIKKALSHYDVLGEDNSIPILFTYDGNYDPEMSITFIQGIASNGLIFTRVFDYTIVEDYDNFDISLHTFEI